MNKLENDLDFNFFNPWVVCQSIYPRASIAQISKAMFQRMGRNHERRYIVCTLKKYWLEPVHLGGKCICGTLWNKQLCLTNILKCHTINHL